MTPENWSSTTSSSNNTNGAASCRALLHATCDGVFFTYIAAALIWLRLWI